MFVLQRCLGVSFSACRVGGPGSPVPFVPPGLCGSALVSYLWSASATSLGPGTPHPSNQNSIGGCVLLRLLLFSNNPSAWVRHLRAVNGSGLVCGVSVRLRVLSVASDLFTSEGCLSSDLSSLYEFMVRWVYTVPVDCNGGGNLRRKILNDGIVGLRLLLVLPMVSIFWLALGSGSDSSLG
ncbi:BnaCnng37870D [Brassica napus]|uniref:BnaCnng37870D protein n=2 Tax=Brassica napus TaxID=3708 RepID=A0A078J859_BRANA|nr:BnaCnng37870D [Brassica napus]